MRFLIPLLFLGLLASCADDDDDKVEANFKSIQANLLNKSCATVGCHLGTDPKAVLNLETGQSFVALQGSSVVTGAAFVDTDNPDISYLLKKLIGEEGMVGLRMPAVATATGFVAGSKVSDDTISAVRKWITDGAVDNTVE